jgi:hypothetical protein
MPKHNNCVKYTKKCDLKEAKCHCCYKQFDQMEQDIFIMCRECERPLCDVCKEDIDDQYNCKEYDSKEYICERFTCIICVRHKHGYYKHLDFLRDRTSCKECVAFLKDHCIFCDETEELIENSGLTFFRCDECHLLSHRDCNYNSSIFPNTCLTCRIDNKFEGARRDGACDTCNDILLQTCFHCGKCKKCLQKYNHPYITCKECDKMICKDCNRAGEYRCCEIDMCQSCRDDISPQRMCDQCNETVCLSCDTDAIMCLDCEQCIICSVCNGRQESRKMKDYIWTLFLSEAMKSPLYDNYVSKIILSY